MSVMERVLSPEVRWEVDPRELASNHGYVASALAPPTVRYDGKPRVVVFGVVLYDAPRARRLLEDVHARLPNSRGLKDIGRLFSPWHSQGQSWRDVRSLESLLGDDDFVAHVHDRLIENDRAGSRPPTALDPFGGPDAGVSYALFSILDEMERSYGPTWARMDLEPLSPLGTALPKGIVADAVLGPRPGADGFVYLFRGYDCERALEVLPRHYVRTFVDEAIRRSARAGRPVDDLVDSGGHPTIFALAAGAEALSRNLIKLSDMMAFIRRRIADKRERLVRVSARTVAEDLQPGLLDEVHRFFCEQSGIYRDFLPEEIEEVVLQSRVHSDDPALIARIVRVACQGPRVVSSDMQVGPLELPRSLAEGLLGSSRTEVA